jgi:hypothetical protein
MEDLLAILGENVGAFLALLGVIIGALLSFLTTRALKTRESKLRLAERVLEHQIEAYEEVAKLAVSLSNVSAIGYWMRRGQRRLVEVPSFMRSAETLQEWGKNYLAIYNTCTFWLEPELGEEIGLLEAYLYELQRVLTQTHAENSWIVGVLIIPDFKTFSTKLQSLCNKYFALDLLELRFEQADSRWAPEIGECRREELATTVLFSRRRHILELAKMNPDELKDKMGFTSFEEEEIAPNDSA